MLINTLSPTTFTTSILIGDPISTVNGSDDSTPILTVINRQSVSAAIEIQSSSGVLLISRLTQAEINSLNSTNGMIVYNLTDNAFNFYSNGLWREIDIFADVTGPNGAIQNDIATFGDNTGKLLIDSGVNIEPVPPPLNSRKFLDFPLVNVNELSELGIIAFSSGSGLIFIDNNPVISIEVNGINSNRSTLFTDGIQLTPTNSSALVELSSTSGALLISRLTTLEIGALDPVNGMIVYDFTNDEFLIRRAGAWQIVGVGAGAGTVTSIDTGTGLVGGPITTTGTISIDDTTVIPGTYNFSTITVNQQGQLTSASTGVPVTNIATSGGLTGGPITSTGTISIANTTVVAGSYTYSTLTVNSRGQLTAASSGVAPVLSVSGTLTEINSTGGQNPILSLIPTGVSAGSHTYTTLTVDIFGRITAASNGTTPVLSVAGTTGQINSTGGTSPQLSIANNPIIPGNASLTIPIGTTAQRPGSPTHGMIRYNTTINALEDYKSAWASILDIGSVLGTMNQIDVMPNLALGTITLSIDPIYVTTLNDLVTAAAASEASASISASNAASSDTNAGLSAIAAAGSAAVAVTAANSASTSETNAAASASAAATSAADIVGATGAKFILQEAHANLTNAQSLGILTTGIVKNTVTGSTGVLSIASAGVDYYAPGFPTFLRDTQGGLDNLFVGTACGNNSLSGTSNVGFGINCLSSLTSGSGNVSIGFESLLNANSATECVAIGYRALKSNTVGGGNIAIGYSSLLNNVIGQFNLSVGTFALSLNTVDANLAVGFFCMQNNTTGTPNTGIGHLCLQSNTIGTNNTGTGLNSLNMNDDGQFNSAYGDSSSLSNVSGNLNCSFGYQSLLNNTSDENCAYGANSMMLNISGTACCAFGFSSLNSNVSGSNNTSIGMNNLQQILSSNNTSVGYNGFLIANSGANNTSLGVNTGDSHSTYNNCLFLGASADTSANSLTNAIAIGYNTHVGTSNSLVLGTGCFVGIGKNSPAYALHLSTDNSSVPLIYIASSTTPAVPGTANDGIYSVNSAKPKFTSGTAIYSGTIVTANSTGGDSTSGNATLNGITGVTVNTTAITTSSIILLGHSTGAGAPTLGNIGSLVIGSIINNTSFVIYSTNILDTSTASWQIINP